MNALLRRIGLLLAAVATLPALWLGFIWPSFYTIVAAFIVPVPGLLVAAAVEHTLFERHKWLARYTWGCVALAVVTFVSALTWAKRL